MKVAEHWLREYVAVAASAAEIAQRFDAIGLEVESLATLGGALDGVVVAQITACQEHPQADRLQLCEVDYGAEAPLTIVCGAPNARPGIKVPLATVGACLPNGTVIKAAKLRGVDSRGMLCSARELGIDEDASGLLELDADAPVGAPLAGVVGLPESVFDLGLTPNRGDCLSIRGAARDLAAAFDVPLNAPEIQPVAPKIDAKIEITLDAPAACPRYCARVVRSVDAGAASAAWLKQRLRRCGVRPVSLLVDVTAYVMLELGQPLHAFDAATIHGAIHARHARAGERMRLLDEREVTLEPDMLLIADEQQPLALAGIMGGRDSRVTGTTRDVLLEAAHFAPSAIIGRARRLGMHTDASHRFERGVDPQLPRIALERATQLIVDLAGGEPGAICEAVADEHLPQRAPVMLRRARLARVLGVAVDDAQVERILRALGMTIEANADGWRATPPSWRFDIAIEEDLIEEVARIHGYDAIPLLLVGGELGADAAEAPAKRIEHLREQLAGRDYHEAVNYAFVPVKALRAWQLDVGAVPLANPLSADFAQMRTALLPGLVQTLEANRRRQRERVRLFEIGRVFHAGEDAPLETERLAIVACGNAAAEQWGEAARAVDLFDLKGDLASLFGRVQARDCWRFDTQDLPPWLHPGRSARVLRDDCAVGFIGALHPQLVIELDLGGPVQVCEIELAPLLEQARASLQPLSRYPAIRRDIAIEIDADEPWARVRECVCKAVGAQLVALRLFDVYQGVGVDEGRKSLAMGLILQDESRTLVDEDADRAVALAVDALKHHCKAKLRGEHGAD